MTPMAVSVLIGRECEDSLELPLAFEDDEEEEAPPEIRWNSP